MCLSFHSLSLSPSLSLSLSLSCSPSPSLALPLSFSSLLSFSGILQLSELVSDLCKGIIVIHTSARYNTVCVWLCVYSVSIMMLLYCYSVREQCTGVFCIMHSLAKHLEDGETVDIMGSSRRALQQRQGCLATKVQL